MSYNMIKKCWLVGAGPMAGEYSIVLDALKVNYEVIGRGERSGKLFESKYGHAVKTGGLEKWMLREEISQSDSAIVAVGVENLASTTINLLQNGFKNLLVEKPAGLNTSEIMEVATETQKQGANVFVAYNRRFYASVIKAQEIIKRDGGITSFTFEFTEWAHVIEQLVKGKGVKENWLLGNSTHVIDLAFYLGGTPTEISPYITGGLNWHPSGSIYAGAGISKRGALFSYNANWLSAGRWSVEVLTPSHRLIFKPLETLMIQAKGKVDFDSVEFDQSLDVNYKPGIFNLVRNFIYGQTENLCTIEEQKINSEIYTRIAGY